MPEIEISIGGRYFEVACQEGEEHYLQTAARMLNTEATNLTQQMGRLPEARMLLMAGLMLADKTAGVEDQVAELHDKLKAQEVLIAELRAQAETATQGADEAPPASDELVTITRKSEALADLLEKLATPA